MTRGFRWIAAACSVLALGCPAVLAGPAAASAAGGQAAAHTARRKAHTARRKLLAGRTLRAGQRLVSPGRQYTLVMRKNGDLAEYTQGHLLWSSGTGGHRGARATLRRSGDLVVRTRSGKVVWATKTGGHPRARYYLAVQPDANLVIYAPGGSPLWASKASDWAAASFCARYGVRYMGTTYRGVAACGNAYPSPNDQGVISYNGVEFDSVGFQCVELAARYFYYVTGKRPPMPGYASEFAYDLGADDGYNVYPAGFTGVTGTFQSSLTPGQIISMWSGSDLVGHVAVVTAVTVSNGNGTITVMDEDAGASGTDTIRVSGGRMSYEGVYPDFQWTTNLPG